MSDQTERDVTVVRIGQYDEAGTACSHCGVTYYQCSTDVMREYWDPKANYGCCDECHDSSGHEVSHVPDPLVARVRELEAALQQSRDDHQGAVEKLRAVEALVDELGSLSPLDASAADVQGEYTRRLNLALASPVESDAEDPK